VHCGDFSATGAPQTFFYNNKLQYSDLTSNPDLIGFSLIIQTLSLLARSGVRISPGAPFFNG
jgi:hypothetical protein